MRPPFLVIVLYLLFTTLPPLSGQGDIIPPVTPVFSLVTVRPETGKTLLTWQSSTSPDVAGYVIYYFKNGEGFAIDTIHDAGATSYLNLGSFASYKTESYVVAAFDSSGNISPLSNELHTVFIVPLIDTCNKRITITWNSYNNSPKAITGFRILFSINNGPFAEAGTTPASSTSLTINNFTANSSYCFEVETLLNGGFSSFSNKGCILTGMQRAPDWINADYATVDEKNSINLSFTVDPLSEINSFRIERKRYDESNFQTIGQVETGARQIVYNDQSADGLKYYEYRLLAVNNCGNSVVTSNLCSNIVPFVQLAGNKVDIFWKAYRYWLGQVAGYKVFINTGDGYHEELSLPPSDTSCVINYASVMYNISGNSLCFKIVASETGNPYGISGETTSAAVCIDAVENITVPNAFTPNNDMINDFFKPVLSFTPLEYLLVITDLQNNLMFESKDFLESWDGKRNGAILPQGVYLWFLKTKAPSGKVISRSGTVTILK
jgi:gliding motility-associated-like protein